jgi:hypothetical protein
VDVVFNVLVASAILEQHVVDLRAFLERLRGRRDWSSKARIASLVWRRWTSLGTLSLLKGFSQRDGEYK